MMDKKELNLMELDTVAGGNFFGDLLDEVENVVEDVWDGVKDVTNEAVEVTWKGMKLVYDTVNPIQ
ncbi:MULTISPECIES: hypothetical protein [Selenomonas]|jgi:hypothetical protein|uniref:Bacteriocin-type signal sequence-containing protein n=1 Tax=Selenomonas ruminantium TaxID=971 RepID=A0A1I0XF08_SELRU|nr:MULTISPECIES: hypothetical protein [Selenomonas]SFA99026.1 hypothetical protein SAMN05216587_105132 [Selenomonas ruminantium]